MEKLSREKMMFLPGFAATIRLYRLKAKWELFRKVEETDRSWMIFLVRSPLATGMRTQPGHQ